MDLKTILSCVFISAGAFIMLVAIFKSAGVQQMTTILPDGQRHKLKMYLFVHRSMMVFFLLGYIASIVAIVFEYPLLSEIFVSLIFLFGAVFVYMGIHVQSQLMSDIQLTIQGIVPICVKCKKIHATDGQRDEWVRIENYISDNTEVDFSHGYCPECFVEEMTHIENTK